MPAWALAALSILGTDPSLVPRRATVPGISRFDQVHGGLPVLGHGVAISGGRTDEALERALPASIVPTVTSEEAARTAATYTRVPVTARDARLVVSRGELAWLVVPAPAPGLATSPRIVVGATTGRLLEARDAARGVRASVYPRNPVRDPSPVLSDLPLAPPGATLTSPRLVARSCVDEGSTRTVTLAGGAERVVRTCALLSLASADPSGDFVYAPAPAAPRDPFAEVSLYFHAATALSYLERLGGAPVREVPLDLVANVQVADGLLDGDFATAARTDRPLVPFPSALYLPGAAAEGEAFGAIYGVASGALWFGGTYERSFAYDGDVVAHEMTHAVLDVVLHTGGLRLAEWGASAEPEAMNEALADYFAAALTNDPVIGEYAAGEAPELVRTLEDPATCADIVGRSHEDGRILASALWTVRRAQPDADAFDRAIYRALFRSPGRSDLVFAELAELLLAGLDADLPSATGALRAELGRRGVLPRCAPVIDVTPTQTVRAPASTYFAPGTAAFGADLAPGVVQLRVPIPAGARRLAVRFSASQETPSALFGRKDAAFRPVVLAAFGEPLRFTREGDHVAVNGARADAVGEGTRSAELDVPPGASVAYVQIANTGDADGAYDVIGFSFPDPPSAQPAPQSGYDAGGCTLGRPRSGDRGGRLGPPWWLALLAALARRRRRHGASV